MTDPIIFPKSFFKLFITLRRSSNKNCAQLHVVSGSLKVLSVFYKAFVDYDSFLQLTGGSIKLLLLDFFFKLSI